MRNLLFTLFLLSLIGYSFAFAQAPASVPSAPSISSVVAGDGQVTIYFDISTSTGTSTEAFRIVSNPGDLKFTATSSPIIFTGLQNGTEYSFIMTAINSVGSSLPSATSSSVIPDQIVTPIIPSAPVVEQTVKDNGNSGGGGEIQIVSSSTTPVVENSEIFTTGQASATYPVQNISEELKNENNTVIGSVTNTVKNITKTVGENVAVVAQVTQDIVVNTRDYVNTPTGDKVTKTITTAGVFGSSLAAVSSSFASPLAIPEMFLIPLRLWGLLLTTFGLKRKNRSWGTVYDSVTKQPIDPAVVTLRDLSGNEIASSITDIDGRYGFLVEPGKYLIEVKKTNYSYPSSKLSGKISDEVYNNLYFGQEINVEQGGAVVNKNIPMDAMNFDWNEFAKGKNRLMSFYSKKEMALGKLSDVLFEVGLIIAVLALLFAPEPYNIGIVALYLIVLGFKIFGIKTKTFGKLSEMTDGSPLSYAIVKIFSEDFSVEILKKVADKYGRYYCLLPVGKYHVEIDKKNNDETYTEIYRSPALDINEGVLNRNFSV